MSQTDGWDAPPDESMSLEWIESGITEVEAKSVELQFVRTGELSPQQRKIARIIVRQSLLPRGERDTWLRMNELDRLPKSVRGVGGCFASLDYLARTMGRGKARVSGYRASLHRRCLVSRIGTRGRYVRWATAIPPEVAYNLPHHAPTQRMLAELVSLFNETLNLQAPKSRHRRRDCQSG